MGTATSRPALALAAVAIVGAGCGGSGHSSSGSAGSSAGTGSAAVTTSGGAPAGSAAFAWLRPQAAPAGWRLARIRSGAVLAYPPSWRPVKGDPGTATAALIVTGGRYLGYLNATPQQGAETFANWRTFRIEHNRDEGDRMVTRLAAATGLPFLNGRGSCVKDAYTTALGRQYIEIACLVSGPRANSVIVGAAPPSSWAQTSATIERAISAFRT